MVLAECSRGLKNTEKMLPKTLLKICVLNTIKIKAFKMKPSIIYVSLSQRSFSFLGLSSVRYFHKDAIKPQPIYISYKIFASYINLNKLLIVQKYLFYKT